MRRVKQLEVDGPTRTCVITRTAGPPASLVRLVVDPDGVLQVDYQARLGGRGAWVTPHRDTLATAESRPGQLAKALHVPACDTRGLLDRVRQANERTSGELLSLASRAGALASGAEQVESAVRSGSVLGLVIASDASPTSVQAATGSSSVESWSVPWDREALGRRIGKGPRAIVALRPASITRALVEQLRRMHDLR